MWFNITGRPQLSTIWLNIRARVRWRCRAGRFRARPATAVHGQWLGSATTSLLRPDRPGYNPVGEVSVRHTTTGIPGAGRYEGGPENRPGSTRVGHRLARTDAGRGGGKPLPPGL